MEPIKIKYKFEFEQHKSTQYELVIDPKTMTILNPNPTKIKWTELGHDQCSNCPWTDEKQRVEHPYCPVAQNLYDVATAFADYKSFKEVQVIVFTPERTYGKKVDLQTGLQGIFGLIMATSGCPHMNFLKPMARFHLPFSSHTETIARSVSFYLLKQYFNSKEGKTPDWTLKGLEEKYNQVTLLNQGMIRRIRGVSEGDADRNALIVLDTFASLLTMEIQEDMGELKSSLTFGDPD